MFRIIKDDNLRSLKSTYGDIDVLKTDDLDVFGDLTVTGCIDNPCLDIVLTSSDLPSSDEIYDSWQKWPRSRVWVLRNEQDASVAKDFVFPGTEPGLGTLVYGYNDDQTLDTSGGPAKSYNATFTKYDWKYHDTELNTVVTFPPMKAAMDRIISWNLQRGMPLPAPDVAPKMEGMYIALSGAGQTQTLVNGDPFVAMRLIYGVSSTTVPEFVDIVAYWQQNDGHPFVLDTFIASEAERLNGHCYPLRVPVVTDCCEFAKMIAIEEPISYFDTAKRQFTVNVKNVSHTTVNLELSPVLPDTYGSILRGFEGTFKLAKRSFTNEIVSATAPTSHYIVQVSPQTLITTTELTNGVPLPVSQAVQRENDSGSFQGVLLALMNGESRAVDVYSYPNFTNALVFTLDPFTQYPDQGFGQGDNPNSKLIEKISLPSMTVFYDNPLLLQISVLLSDDVRAGLTYPEQVGNSLLTPPPTFGDAFDVTLTAMAHEYVHSNQEATNARYGEHNFVNAESIASGIELDQTLAPPVFPYRGWLSTDAIADFLRGGYQLMEQPDFFLERYGLNIFWRYLATSVDPNNQVARRINDILASETLGPFTVANNLPLAIWTPDINPAGVSLAAKQALQELYTVDIADVLQNFAISMAFIRNNTSIPVQYRHAFPWWLWNRDYNGYNVWSQASGALWLGLAGCSPALEMGAYWWEVFDKLDPIPPTWGNCLPLQYAGQPFTPVLPANFSKSLADLSVLLFTVPAGTTTVTVTITAGNWRLAMVSFKSDGTPVGVFNIDGPHAINGAGVQVFNAAGFPVDSDYVKLVCANTTITDQGSVFTNFYSLPPPSGSISIVSV